MNGSLPLRAKDSRADHCGAGPLNVNSDEGAQTNNTISGGSNNQQFNGPTTIYPAQRETPPLPLSTVPFTRDGGFIERPEFAELQDKLIKGGRRIALAGLGGVGKSQLAIEYCHRLRDSSPETWVLWIHASNAARFDQDVQTLANDVKIAGRKEKDADIYELVRAWLLDSKKRWLIVLDNADDADFLFETRQSTSVAGQTRSRIEYFPVCAHGSILITTRRLGVARRLVVDKLNIIELHPDKDHATALLESKLSQKADTAILKRLASALEYMPLAIAQAAAYIEKKTPRCSPEDYLAKLEKSDRSRSSLLKIDSSELRRDSREAKNSVLLTWQISFEHIYNSRQSAAELLALMSFYDYQGIPEMLVKATSRGEQDGTATRNDYGDDSASESSTDSITDSFENDIDTLRDYSFVSVAPDGTTFEMHRLVQLATQVWLRAREQYEHWEARILARLDTVFPRPDHEHWEGCRILFPHVKLALTSKVSEQSAQLLLASILYRGAWFAEEQGWYKDSEAMARRSLSLRRGALGLGDPDTLSSMDIVALAMRDQGKYSEAVEMQRRVLLGREKVLGPEHPDTLISVGNLALMFTNQGRWKEAEKLIVKVIESSRKVLGAEHSDTLTRMTNLASTYSNQGRWKEAEELEVKVMETRRRELGAEHPSTLTSMGNLASTYNDQGRWYEAEELEVKVLETSRKVLGLEHPDTLTSMTNLAATYSYQERWSEAETLQVEELDICKRVLGPEHPDTLVSMANLASTYRGQGRLSEAETLQAKELDISKRVLGAEHPSTLTSMANLAHTYDDQNRLQEALTLARRCLELRTVVLGPTHPSTLTSSERVEAIEQAMQATSSDNTHADQQS